MRTLIEMLLDYLSEHKWRRKFKTGQIAKIRMEVRAKENSVLWDGGLENSRAERK